MRLSPLLLLVIYLAAVAAGTLWPFNFRQPNLAQAGSKGGLVFIPPSTAYAQSPPGKIAQTNSFTLLIRLSGHSRQGKACIVDYAVDERHFNFRMEQQDDQFIFSATSAGEPPWVFFRVPKVFGKNDTISAAITCSGSTFSLWTSRGFERIMEYPRATRLRWDSTAKLTLGCMVNGKYGWRGTIFSLAVFDRPLAPRQLRTADSLITNNQAVLAYDFPQIMGGVVIDRGKVLADPLLVPELYRVPGHEVLASPAQYLHGRGYVRDILLNIFGFIPFGFLVFMLLSGRTGTIAGMVIAVAAGALTSLSIELLQAVLPARNSSMVDLISNTVGAGLGAWISLQGWPQRILRILGIRIESGNESGGGSADGW